MTISYNWLSSYLPVTVAPERLSHILTSIGLEVESMEPYEAIKGGLKGLVIGQVLETAPHPNADKLVLTQVTLGGAETLQIVCGAPNVAAGQKVIVAPEGSTIFPKVGEPMTMKNARIRGMESHGMICAEDEIGFGDSHAGILVLPDEAPLGASAADYFQPYEDIIYEIGLTPNRSDAMSHWGVARDVCAYLSHHDGSPVHPARPKVTLPVPGAALPIQIIVENSDTCPRYSGICIAGVRVAPSPRWLQDRLQSIGVRPINNIVDITNFILHETGQPLHAFDYDAIEGRQVIVKNAASDTPFKSLDSKVRTLSGEDLMICNTAGVMCIAGVFGGFDSGVSANTTNIFLESAFFDPGSVRKTSFRHGLRTDAAARFEKGIDISATVNILQRAATLLLQVAGGAIASDVMDVFPHPAPKNKVELQYSYLKKLSGKTYPVAAVKAILESLGFVTLEVSASGMLLEVPYHKTDVGHSADIVEEILRIDGLDAIEIPGAITMTPAIDKSYHQEALKEKTASALVGLGFTEILTNSITNSRYFTEAQGAKSIKLLNNLSLELDVLRPAMLPTALEVIAFNNNRKNNNLQLFEFGKTYQSSGIGTYTETNHLCLYTTGQLSEGGWKKKGVNTDIYHLKGLAQSLLNVIGLQVTIEESESGSEYLEQALTAFLDGKVVAKLGRVATATAARFDVRQPVYFANFNWNVVIGEALRVSIKHQEVPRFPVVGRDLAVVVDSHIQFSTLENSITDLQLSKLANVKLFDIFESEKLGQEKKSLAINLIFSDSEKTLTDKEVDSWMGKIMGALERSGAEIRKQ